MVLVPLFQSEIAPPATRGFLVSQHGKHFISSLSLEYFTDVTRCCCCLWLLSSRLDRVWLLLFDNACVPMALPALPASSLASSNVYFDSFLARVTSLA